ncbi:MAG: 2-phospho-L-lactate guanylyltransferase [Cellulomonas sp.]|nr:2-phospho-L-lactate guanylyltransferase [Cellulomonas sp.]
MCWAVVIPVKDAARGKSRLRGALADDRRAALVRAMALDTIEAARAGDSVAVVIVVSGDVEVTKALAGHDRVRVRPEPVPGPDADPLGTAVDCGLSYARQEMPGTGSAVLLGDLPMLRTAELESALVAAARHPRAFVADAEGTGTTLLTARAGVRPVPAFGPGSAAAHERAGHVRLAVPPASGLRRDVDLPADLVALRGAAIGPRTAALLG